MPDAPRPLQIPRPVAISLERLAASRGVPTCRKVRRALAHYLVASDAPPEAPPLLVSDLMQLWEALAATAPVARQPKTIS